MKPKKIYVRPGTTLVIHVVTDEEEELNHSGWAWQLHPRNFLLTVDSSKGVTIHGDDIDVYGGRQNGKEKPSNETNEPPAVGSIAGLG